MSANFMRLFATLQRGGARCRRGDTVCARPLGRRSSRLGAFIRRGVSVGQSLWGSRGVWGGGGWRRKGGGRLRIRRAGGLRVLVCGGLDACEGGVWRRSCVTTRPTLFSNNEMTATLRRHARRSGAPRAANLVQIWRTASASRRRRKIQIWPTHLYLVL